MITRDTLLKDLYANTPLEKYSHYFYYGFGNEWQDKPFGHFCDGLWGNNETVKALINFEKYFYEGKVKTIYLNEKCKDVNVTVVSQNKKATLAFVIAGGGYSSVATAVEGLPIGDYLYSKGYAVAYLTYSINKDALNDGSYHDLVKALKYLNEHQDELKIDMKNYLIGGCSAGGHLAARIGTDNSGYKKVNLPKPGIIFLAYPVTSFTDFAHEGSLRCVLGENPNIDERHRITIYEHVDNNFPPVYMWQCRYDKGVPIQNSMLLDEALTKNKIPHIYNIYESDAHGWGLGVNTLADGWVDKMLQFYKKVCKS